MYKTEYRYWTEDNGVLYDSEINIPSLQELFKNVVYAHNPDRLYYFNANHLGSGSLITDKNGQTYQTLIYAPHGEVLFNKFYGDYDEVYKFTGYEKDNESGLNYAKARYQDPNIGFNSTDPHCFKYSGISPYAYSFNNPIMLIDPTGMDTLVFNSENKFDRAIPSSTIIGKKEGKNGFLFQLADPENDQNSIKNGDISELYIATDAAMLKDIERSGANKDNNKGPIAGILFLFNHSRGGKNKDASADYYNNSGIHGNTDHGYGKGLKEEYYYITDVNGHKIGHNAHNFGNFLWGATAHTVGVSLGLARWGANIDCLFNERTYDSKDDQFSIGLGYFWHCNLINIKK